MNPEFDVPLEAEVLPVVSPSVNGEKVTFVVNPPNLKPEFDVSVEAEVLPGASPSVYGEEVAFVVKLASEMSPGVTGFVASAGLPKVNPDSPKIKIKAIMNNFSNHLNGLSMAE